MGNIRKTSRNASSTVRKFIRIKDSRYQRYCVSNEGELIILDWCRDYWILKLLNPVFKFIDPAYQHCYTQAELERLLKATGFDVEKDSKVRFGSMWELIAASAIAIN